MVIQLKRARKNRRAAFTLIELLVVVLILGILLAVAIPLYLSSVKNSAEQATRGNLRTIGQAAQAYKVRHNAYPTTPTHLEGDLPAWPTGPRTVTYTLGTDGVVTANEGTEDTFGAAKTGDTITFDITTGKYDPEK